MSAASCTDKLDNGDTDAKGYIRSIIDAVELDDNAVRIIGSKDVPASRHCRQTDREFVVLYANGAPRPMKMGTTASP
jgi:hypothetical protein